VLQERLVSRQRLSCPAVSAIQVNALTTIAPFVDAVYAIALHASGGERYSHEGRIFTALMTVIVKYGPLNGHRILATSSGIFDFYPQLPSVFVCHKFDC